MMSHTQTSQGHQQVDPASQQESEASPAGVDFPTVGSADVAIFWDFENVRIPVWCPTSTAAEGIRNKVSKYGRIVEKRLYYDSRLMSEFTAPRSELDLSGFTLVDCPSRNRKETLDKKLIVDVLCFAWERASRGAKACVVLITSDGDYSYAIARLRDIGVFTVIIYRPDVVAKVLIDNANVVMSWEFDVLGGPPQAIEDEENEVSVQSIPHHMLSSKNQAVVGDNAVNDRNTSVSTSPAEAPFHDTEEGIKDIESHGCDAPVKDEEIIVVDNTEEESPRRGLQSSKDYEQVVSELSTSSEFQSGTTKVQVAVTEANPATKGKFAMFFSVILNQQHRTVKEGISVHSSWAIEGTCADEFYSKIGEKDRKAYQQIRSTAFQKGFIEWGRRNLNAPGKPVIKVKDRDHRAKDLSSETYLRLTYSGLAVLEPESAPEGKWTMVVPKPAHARAQDTSSESQSLTTSESDGRIFVGGLAWETTEDSLRSYFLKFGPLSHVIVMYGRGFGFVFFRDPRDANAAMNSVQNHIIDNKLVE